MKIAFLTCGPRGAGKTTYCYIANAYHPELEIISRDNYLIMLYGSTLLSESKERMNRMNELLIERLKEIIQKSDKVIIDYWNTTSSARKNTIQTLREIGFEKVVCLYFITPLEFCDAWVQKKFDSDYYSARFYKNSYESFYKKSEDISGDGFDRIITIDASNISKVDLTNL